MVSNLGKKITKARSNQFFDRSWFSRALIQPSMNYCSESQYKYFMKNVNKWEYSHIENGLILIKFYLSLSKENQELRFHLRNKFQNIGNYLQMIGRHTRSGDYLISKIRCSTRHLQKSHHGLLSTLIIK